ncbi:tripartite tricarboxylate transporter TctB family protein [Anaeromyxobacter terrae]|uniref:tripartite tricarboxylate transporter TctB family protein n=1 Tax=Anaeromyxobacter terrae TaxID=2925406 RepID=UPI001F58C1BA|nr:tripartite tricarboxylate transporter TctB family protein [Anaeromyxobacter sp. SG22]
MARAPDDEDVVEARREEGAGGVGARARARGWLAAHGRFCGLWIVVLGYFVFMPELGFPLGSALALAAMGRLLGERRWHVVVGGALVVTAVLHLTFAKGLGVRLPLGVLSFLGK